MYNFSVATCYGMVKWINITYMKYSDLPEWMKRKQWIQRHTKNQWAPYLSMNVEIVGVKD